jgi:hypothetical protein
MRDFLATLKRPSGVATLIALIAALSGAVVISNLIGRVEKLEADLGRVKSDFDHPRPRPILDALP